MQQLLVPGGVFILADPAGAVAGVEVVLFAVFSCSATAPMPLVLCFQFPFSRVLVWHFGIVLIFPGSHHVVSLLHFFCSVLPISCERLQEQVRGRAMELMKVLATEGAASGRPLSLASLPVSMSVPIEDSEPADVDVIVARLGKR
eukprot:COSAG02_NODE_1406_length_12786_cov_5.493418_17_plen_145_part_00